MGSVEKLVAEVRRGLEEAHPGRRQTLLKKRPLAVAAMVEARTPNTREIAALLPLEVERSDRREQWLRRVLKKGLLASAEVMEPFARQALEEAARGGRALLLLMDQTDIGERFAILVVSVRLGDRALPLVWRVEAGEANIGFEGQKPLLEQVHSWLPAGVRVMVRADRFYPSAGLFEWLHARGWHYRLRLKGNLTVAVGRADIATTADLAAGVAQRYEPDARFFSVGVPTALGVVHEPGHREPWIVAMDCRPSKAAVLDYGARWAIEPMFSDFKTRGFRLEDTQLEHPDRLARLMLSMALAMYWCVAAGRADALANPTPTEKKSTNRQTPITGRSKSSIAARYRGSNAAFVCY